jgi:hypothetical protein
MVMEQNYFQFDQHYYIQTEGLAMGDPTSTILSEVYIHLLKHQIIGYFRYVNDILII